MKIVSRAEVEDWKLEGKTVIV